MQEGSLFSTPLAFIGCGFFDDGHSDQYEVISHCSFDLHFSNNQWYWASFHVFISCLYVFFVASLVVQMVKNSLAMQEIQVQSLGWEGPWRREWHSTPVFLPGESPWTEDLAGYSLRGHKELDMIEQPAHTYLLWRNICLGLLPTFWLGCLFFWHWVVWA